MTNQQPYLDTYSNEHEVVVRLTVPRGYEPHDSIPLLLGNASIMNCIVQCLANKYVEEHGAEILKQIAPDAVQKAVEQHIAKKLFGEKS